MKTNGPSAAAAAAAAVAGVLTHPARRATPETLSLDSTVTHQPTAAADNSEPSNTAQSQVSGWERSLRLLRSLRCVRCVDGKHAYVVSMSTGGKFREKS